MAEQEHEHDEEQDFFFWTVEPPVREGKELEAANLTRQLSEIAERTGDDDPTPEDEERFETLLGELHACMADKCDLAGAKRMKTRPDFDEVARRVFDEEVEESDLSFAEFKEMFAEQPDCENCSSLLPYSHDDVDPCETTPMFIQELVRDPAVIEKVQYEMEPAAMLELADDLQRVLDNNDFSDQRPEDAGDEFEPREYLVGMVRFLRTWAERDCRLSPAFFDVGCDCDDEETPA
jgi:hypothetical protein